MVILTMDGINTIGTSMMNEEMSDDDEPSSPESHTFDEHEVFNNHINDEVTAQLAAAGTIGMAAAAAIASGRKRKRPHLFETNPSIRKRQQTRILKKLKNTIEEYSTRVGQQAIVLCCTPGKATNMGYKVFGSQPLESVVRNIRSVVMQDLEASLAQQAPPQQADNPALHELPPLFIDGIPTPVDKMTQAQLRAFIPEMLKYSTGRSKPGWGKLECQPPWWPHDVPWANVRSDVRSDEQKKKVSWTHALRTIVKNCYKFHGREDLMPEFHDHEQTIVEQTPHFAPQTMVQTINNPDGTLSIIQIETGDMQNAQLVTLADGTQAQVVHTVGQSQLLPWHAVGKHEDETPWHTVGKPEDGTFQKGYSFEVCKAYTSNNPHGQQEANQAVQTLAEVASHQQQGHHHLGSVAVEVDDVGAHAVASLAEAHVNTDGHIILTADHAQALAAGNLFLKTGNTISGMVTIPVSMYQTVVSSLPNFAETDHNSNVQIQLASNSDSESMHERTEMSSDDTVKVLGID